ncbi:MAG: SDR family NAD(P)-dependent oxidoreductase [Bacteroidia bacterium]
MTLQPTAIITGASRGIGAACAKALAQNGFRLALLARNLPELEEVARHCQAPAHEILCLQTDLRNESEILSAVQLAKTQFGQIDILINNAGIGSFGPIESLAYNQLEEMLRINLMAPYKLCQLLLPEMKARNSGHIVNILSDAARRSFRGGTAYCASKYAFDGMLGCLREEIAAFNIRLTNVYPGLVNTWFNNKTPQAPAPGRLEASEVAEYVLKSLFNPDGPDELFLSAPKV